MSTLRVPHLASRLQGLGTTVFSQMTQLAVEHDAINLGQGFPDQSPPAAMVAAAKAAMDAGHHQYAPGPGVPQLRQAIASHQRDFYGLEYEPDSEVTVTFGATEAMAATLLGVCEVGDEVVVLDPAYDAYAAIIALAGAIERRVPLTPPDFTDASSGWTLDVERFAAALTPKTRAVIINSPHNPTGAVLDASTLAAIAEHCVRHDVVVITDEVYEHLVFEGRHQSIATQPGMRERTVVISSAGKTFSATGWKIGWACAPAALAPVVRTTKQFLSFAGGTPLQYAVAEALDHSRDFVTGAVDDLRAQRDVLCDGLLELGFATVRSAGTYFLTADLSSVGFDDAEAFCWWAPEAVGVAAVPVSAFVADASWVRSIVRFAVCKQPDVLHEALERLAKVRT